MKNLPQQIQGATKELRRIEHEIEAAKGDKAAFSAVEVSDLKQFKAAVDYVRQLVWTYLQAESTKTGQNLEEEVRSLRLQHVTEMLQAIRREVKVRQLTPNTATTSFLNAVQDIADAAFDKHVSSKPGEKAS